MGKHIESKRRFLRGNRGTPNDYIAFKSAPLCDVYIVAQKLGATEVSVVMTFEEAVKLREVLDEHLAIGEFARECGGVK